MNILRFNSLPSTSTYAKENAVSLPLPSIITARHQSAGRGRRGNSFFSPEETGLYFTLLFEADQNASLITPAAAVSVCRTIENLSGKMPQIKWVNDIFLNGKKICGILTEAIILNGKRLISVGIGINISTKSFPPELTQAGSLNADISKENLMLGIADRLLSYAENPDNKKIKDEYEKRLFIIGKSISYYKNNTLYTATVKGINSLCNLKVINSNGDESVLSSGEISIII